MDNISREQLAALADRWDQRARQALLHAEQNRGTNPTRAQYLRGVADGLKAALDDLHDTLNPSVDGDTAEATSVEEESFAAVSLDAAKAALAKAGLTIAELHAHKDNTFTAIFSTLQALSSEESIRN